jgi:5-methylcytosine-specific restriction protein A
MRQEFPARVKALALKRCMDDEGIPRCEKCDAPLKAANTNYDHDTPDGLGGAPVLENCKVLCKTCHLEKTHGSDNPRMQKADRVRKKHFGIKKPRTITRWRNMRGELVTASRER